MDVNKISRIIVRIFIIWLIVSNVVVLSIYPDESKQQLRAEDTGWSQEGVQGVVNANNWFAFDLYSTLSKSETGNIFYSPYSISTALAMTYEGSRGQTAEEIKTVFHFPENNILRQNFAKIYNDINAANSAYELRTTNALWVQQYYPLFTDYIKIVEKYYRGKAINLDFVKETEKSRQIINSFIEEQTNHKIKDLIPSGVLAYGVRFILTNVIYFKGIWEWKFQPENTKEMDFKITDKDVVKVPMMYMKPDNVRFNYADTEDLQILELPYKGEKISMLILLPKKDLNSIEPLTIQKLEKWKSKMQKTKLDGIYLPKIKFETKYILNENLKDLGMPTAFSSNADFSGMTSAKGLFISDVIHQAFIEINEEGTEAAGATAVLIAMGISTPTNLFIADHPFIFIIQQRETGNILFIGKVVDPVK